MLVRGALFADETFLLSETIRRSRGGCVGNDQSARCRVLAGFPRGDFLARGGFPHQYIAGKPARCQSAAVGRDCHDRIEFGTTQREHFPLVQVKATYDTARDDLVLVFPDGDIASGVPEQGDPITASRATDAEGETTARLAASRNGAALKRPVMMSVCACRYFDGVPMSSQ